MLDFRAAAAAALLAVTAAALAPAAASPHPDRRAQDRPDDLRGYQIHVVYFLPSDSQDRRLDVDPRLQASLSSMQSWVLEQTGGRTWRFDEHRGSFDVTFVRGRAENGFYIADGNPLARVSEELEARGFDQERTKKRYLVLYDGDTSATGYCGIADYPIYGASTYAGTNDGVRLGGAVAIVNTRSVAGCRPLDFGTRSKPGFFPAVALHELTHLEGLVAPGAPRTCRESIVGLVGGHVCTLGPAAVQDPSVALLDPESRDLMFPGAVRPLAELELDLNDDDYSRSSTALLNFEQSAYLTGGSKSGGRVVRPDAVVPHTDAASTSHTH